MSRTPRTMSGGSIIWSRRFSRGSSVSVWSRRTLRASRIRLGRSGTPRLIRWVSRSPTLFSCWFRVFAESLILSRSRTRGFNNRLFSLRRRRSKCSRWFSNAPGNAGNWRRIWADTGTQSSDNKFIMDFTQIEIQLFLAVFVIISFLTVF